MEILAFTYSAVAYEDPEPMPEVRLPADLESKVSRAAWSGLLASTTFLTVAVSNPNAALAQLFPGDSGPAVESLQSSLQGLNFYRGATTGFYGALTTSAVANFQRERGLPITGIADEATLAELNLSGGDVDRPGGGVGGRPPGGDGDLIVDRPGGGVGGVIIGNRFNRNAVVHTPSNIGLNMRTEPWGTIIGAKPDGAGVTYDPRSSSFVGHYTWVETIDRAWMAKDFLVDTGSTGGTGGTGGVNVVSVIGFSPRRAEVNTQFDPLTVRSGPSVNSTAIASIAPRTTVRYNRRARLANGEEWYFLPDYGGWVSGEFLLFIDRQTA